jgi:hypothetical protein
MLRQSGRGRLMLTSGLTAAGSSWLPRARCAFPAAASTSRRRFYVALIRVSRTSGNHNKKPGPIRAAREAPVKVASRQLGRGPTINRRSCEAGYSNHERSNILILVNQRTRCPLSPPLAARLCHCAYCASPDLKGGQIMSAFEQSLIDNPKTADEPYGRSDGWYARWIASAARTARSASFSCA